ncbi:MAG: apolipoprotein N-acyltransferase [Deltaproteobacteria bacterium]|nr:apolipoprotein N-acyltransferase [Deltaproteobacteria bacterium]RLB43539.1 MAG: apolipoprotein N-acyltransferase [Deltaproteobacteria bacterium]
MSGGDATPTAKRPSTLASNRGTRGWFGFQIVATLCPAFFMKPTDSLLSAYGLSALGGVMLFLGWAGFGIWPLEMVALVPLWAALEIIADRAWGTKLGVGWLYGTVGIAGGYHWMFEFSEAFSGFGTPINAALFVVFSMYLGLQYGIQGLLYLWIRARGGSVATAALSTLIATEWLFPRLFPDYLGNALIELPLLVQTADLGGPLLVSLLVGIVNLVVFEAIRWRRGARAMPLEVSAAAFGFVAVTLLYGAFRIARVDAEVAAAPSIEVGLVQANMGIFEKHEQMLEGHRRHLEQSRDLEAQGPLDLLVWPESAYNYPRFGRALPVLAKEVRADLKTPILFGGLTFAFEGKYGRLYNSVFLIDQDGFIGQTYDKTRLAMFGEYIPFGDRFPRLYALSPNSGRFEPGTHVAPLSLGPWRISTPICYEDVLPDLVRRMVTGANPHILINLTNDGWFGDTHEPWIHLRLAQFRAVEHRRYLVRATNSGVSAVIDPVGRVVASTRVGTRENLRATVHMLHGQTLYAQVGDWPGWLSLLVVGLTLIRRQRPVG